MLFSSPLLKVPLSLSLCLSLCLSDFFLMFFVSQITFYAYVIYAKYLIIKNCLKMVVIILRLILMFLIFCVRMYEILISRLKAQ